MGCTMKTLLVQDCNHLAFVLLDIFSKKIRIQRRRQNKSSSKISLFYRSIEIKSKTYLHNVVCLVQCGTTFKKIRLVNTKLCA